MKQLILFIVTVVMSSCTSSKGENGYDKAMRDGFSKISITKNLDKEFNCVSFITQFKTGGKEEWQTVFLINNVYQCEMGVPIKVAPDDTITVIGKVDMVISRIREVKQNSTGQYEFSYWPAEQVNLTEIQISKFIKSGFKPEEIGLKKSAKAIPNAEKYMDRWEHLKVNGQLLLNMISTIT